MKRASLITTAIVAAIACAATLFAVSKRETTIGILPMKPSLENRTADNRLYTPSTQSLLREHSWLEQVESIDLRLNSKDEIEARFEVDAKDTAFADRGLRKLAVHHLPSEFLVPRLHYSPASPPDEFDALNLMLGEYSRNGVSVPRGSEGDTMAHYTTNLTDSVPWKLRGDYDFIPNPDYCPLRFSVINNCLRPGLWEISAVDRTGEIYHSWFDMPSSQYYQLVGDVNGLSPDFVKPALEWKEGITFPLDLDRLRQQATLIASVPVTRKNAEISFSSQDSRRKLHKNYVQVETSPSEWRAPQQLDEILKHPVHMASFEEPGIYYDDRRRQFDFNFLANPLTAKVSHVDPKTSYRWRKEKGRPAMADAYDYIEVDIDLGEGKRLILGNLPLELLVKQEDYVIHGFGVGILEASALAERRRFLIDKGPCPSFAYLAEANGASLAALNSHAFGIEQVFLRSYPGAETPYWELIITSFERIVDLVKYHIEIPESLRADQVKHSENYTPPVFFTYQDNNVN